jgi:hypothetical protein
MAKKAKAQAVKKSKARKTEIVNLKVTSQERGVLNALAKKHAGGNISAWLRHSGLNYRPGKTEIVP